MKKICFIGAPGSGKTTLYRNLISEKTDKSRWVTSDEAKIFIINNKLKSSKKRVFPVVLKYLVSEKYKNRVIDYFLKEYFNESFNFMREKYKKIFEIADEGLKKQVVDPVSRMLAASFFVRMAKTEMLIDFYNPEINIVYDDSVWQSLRGITQDTLDSGLTGLDEKVLPDIVIYCKKTDKVIVEQIKQRKKDGKINNCHYSLTDEELLESVRVDMENASNKISWFKKSGIRVINIEPEDSILNSTIKIKKILQE